MDSFILALLAAAGLMAYKNHEQRQRVVLLGSHLGQFQIEKLMESLSEGYLRALGESDPERRDQVWGHLQGTEQALCDQLARFVADFARVDGGFTRVSRLPLGLPGATRWWPSQSFDLRPLLAVHANGMAAVARNEAGLSQRDKAYCMCAEIFLLQHSCHWFCRSKAVASARLLARHKTPYAQVLAAVSPATRQAYRALTGV